VGVVRRKGGREEGEGREGGGRREEGEGRERGGREGERKTIDNCTGMPQA